MPRPHPTRPIGTPPLFLLLGFLLGVLLLISVPARAYRKAHHTAHSRPARPHKPKPDIHQHPGKTDPPRGHPVHWAKPPPDARKGKWIGRVVYEWGYYDGEWQDGSWHGVGECHHDKDARTYKGEFQHHHMHGQVRQLIETTPCPDPNCNTRHTRTLL